MLEPEETKRPATVGRLAEMMEAKIVDPVTGEALPPGHRGELWLRGPIVMKGDASWVGGLFLFFLYNSSVPPDKQLLYINGCNMSRYTFCL